MRRSLRRPPFFILNNKKMRARKNLDSARRQEVRETEELLGENITNIFGTRDLEVFEENLKTMKYEDMIELARKLGINVRQPSQRIVATLKREFVERYGTSKKEYSLDEIKRTKNFDDLSEDDRDEIRDLMYVRSRDE
jgi:hypothetical protein